MGIGMMLQYQWGQNNLTAATGTIISPNTSGTTSTSPSGNPSSVAQNQTGFSPDDGYSTTGIGQDGVQSVRFYSFRKTFADDIFFPTMCRCSWMRHRISGKMQAKFIISFSYIAIQVDFDG